MPRKLKSPPTWNFEVGGTSAFYAWLPLNLKSPPLGGFTLARPSCITFSKYCMYLSIYIYSEKSNYPSPSIQYMSTSDPLRMEPSVLVPSTFRSVVEAISRADSA